ncbi:caspase-3-like [Mytilus californianus]|uniref:caspase-3-like n=1 Tax=Mytilus californianus TaxID=6549 RepID=UPI0022452C19|nr:caspase-3-like [Mytilus californianus]
MLKFKHVTYLFYLSISLSFCHIYFPEEVIDCWSAENQDKLDACLYKGEGNTKAVPNTYETESNSGQAKISRSHLKQEKYSISSGIAVVINNETFERDLRLPDRIGSSSDAASLYQSFQELGFEHELLSDASNSEMKEKFEEIKNDKEQLEKTGCLIVALLTHGDEDTVYMTDRSIKITTVMSFFSAVNCPELALKPKIFIFQTSRGEGIGRGVNVTVVRDKPRDPNQADGIAEYYDYNKSHGVQMRIPNEADFLAVYSTSHGYGSYRSTEKGTPFVNHLTEEFRNMKEGEDFYKILTRVNRKVGIGYQPNIPRRDVTQMPCFISHLTKKLVLRQ